MRGVGGVGGGQEIPSRRGGSKNQLNSCEQLAYHPFKAPRPLQNEDDNKTFFTGLLRVSNEIMHI